MKILDTTFLLILVGISMAIASMVGYKTSSMDSIMAVGVLIAICIVGFAISKLPILNKMPVILWVSLVAAAVSAPILPFHDVVVELTNKIPLLAVCTPILAYAGLATGKDLAEFKKISWRIIPVSLAVFTGTFIFAALIAQVTLTWEGVIP